MCGIYGVVCSDGRDHAEEFNAGPFRNVQLKSFFLLFLFLLVFSSSEGLCLTLPEHLDYDLTIADIKIGSLSLEAANKGSYVQLLSKGDAVNWVSLFYGVDDKAVSLLTKSQLKGLPAGFAFLPASAEVRIMEGPNKAHKEFIFDYGKKRLTYSDLLKQEKGFFALNETTFDALSGLYYIRHIPLNAGTSVFVNIFNNKQVYKVQVHVLRKERLQTPAGMLDTVVVKANMDCAGDGLIYYPGDIFIWLTDDEKKTPVLIEKKLIPLMEGKLPEFVKKNMPDFLMKKLSAGAIRAVLVKK